ncbi:MAG: replicative DNA helicase [Berkelbacteria bacterium GW2011_GWA2_35_9]|uniref:DNA 5'-3' helicase n=1 Tax=Berkelbacteria bacterium GW2011_GWA2_35_9 TaxID=1618333 RepID=A0A0G0GA22_9BACT|nr:MAG: replicative DNA helicase [Berkelbacteria bacterium GW2011_GWA2_35_9]
MKNNIINKMPPQNVEAEKSLLGSILIDGQSIYKIMDSINPSDFYQTSHQIIYQHIITLIEKRQPVDVVTLSDSLEKSKELETAGGAKYIAQLTTSVNSSAHIVSYSTIIRNSSILRNLISAGSKIVDLAFQEEREITEVIDEAEKALFNVSQSYLSQAFVPIQDILSDSFERIDELHRDKGKIRGVESGFRDIDNLVAGFQPSDLIIIAARPSMGKSSLALNITLNAALKEKKPVAVFSLEMSKDQVVDRLLVNVAGVDSWKLRTGNLSDEDFPRIGEAMGQLSEAPIYIDDSPLLNVIEMRAKLRRLQSEHGLCLIVIDYLQLMEGVRSYGDNNRVQEKQRHPKIPQLADLRESGSIEQDADLVMFIYREDYYEPDSERKNIADILIKKHRHGPIGQAELYFLSEQMKFANFDKRKS